MPLSHVRVVEHLSTCTIRTKDDEKVAIIPRQFVRPEYDPLVDKLATRALADEIALAINSYVLRNREES